MDTFSVWVSDVDVQSEMFIGSMCTVGIVLLLAVMFAKRRNTRNAQQALNKIEKIASKAGTLILTPEEDEKLAKQSEDFKKMAALTKQSLDEEIRQIAHRDFAVGDMIYFRQRDGMCYNMDYFMVDTPYGKTAAICHIVFMQIAEISANALTCAMFVHKIDNLESLSVVPDTDLILKRSIVLRRSKKDLANKGPGMFTHNFNALRQTCHVSVYHYPKPGANYFLTLPHAPSA